MPFLIKRERKISMSIFNPSQIKNKEKKIDARPQVIWKSLKQYFQFNLIFFKWMVIYYYYHK